MKKVLILYKFLPQYRIDFFSSLREKLFENNIELILIYGKLKNKDSKKNDERNLEWAIYRDNKVFKLGSKELLWQPCLDMIPKVDLVIVEQANRLLVNYFLIPLSKIMKFKFAYWGHGANMQIDRNSFKNRFKNIFINQSDYWFAYTKSVQNYLAAKGVEINKITVVNNAINTKDLREKYKDLPMTEVNKLKMEMGVSSDNIGIYCGGIYKEKRIDFLIEASKIIREQIKDFHILFIGDGPDAYKVIDASKKHEWIHYVGAKFGMDKVPYFKMSKLNLMPGAVGLVILDTFAMKTPMITTDFPYHGPEIEYLSNGENGLITTNNVYDYSEAVIALLKNDSIVEDLKKGCSRASTLYSNEDMVKNFQKGILLCLSE